MLEAHKLADQLRALTRCDWRDLYAALGPDGVDLLQDMLGLDGTISDLRSDLQDSGFTIEGLEDEIRRLERENVELQAEIDELKAPASPPIPDPPKSKGRRAHVR